MFLSGKEIKASDIKSAIKRAVINLKFSPIFMGSAYKNKGVQMVLDAVGEFLPAPS